MVRCYARVAAVLNLLGRALMKATPSHVRMATPTLMTLPLEVRLTIRKYTLPTEMEADGCSCKVV